MAASLDRKQFLRLSGLGLLATAAPAQAQAPQGDDIAYGNGWTAS